MNFPSSIGSDFGEQVTLNNELKKIKSKIETLKINVSAGADQDTLREIEKLDKGFEINYVLYLFIFLI